MKHYKFLFILLTMLFLAGCDMVLSNPVSSTPTENEKEEINSIESITKTGTDGLVDTYTIKYTNGKSTTFTVTNGAQGPQGIQGVPGENGHTPVITIGENGNWFIDGVDSNQSARGDSGNGIDITKSSFVVNEDGSITVTLFYTEAEQSTQFTIPAGKDGVSIVDVTSSESDGNTYINIHYSDGSQSGNIRLPKGDNGKSAYEIYCEYYPNYQKTETEWLDDLINGRLGNKAEHTVSFDTQCESIIESQTVLDGEKANKPEDPTRDGYTFKGWFCGDEQWSFIGYSVTSNIELTAKWEKNYTTELEFMPLPDGTYGVSAGRAKYLTTIVIPSTYNNAPVSTILENGFKDCNSIVNVTIGNQVKTIEQSAFEGCYGIIDLVIPNNVETMKDYCFYKCYNLQSVEIGSGVTSIPKYAFAECNQLFTLKMGENVKEIKPYAFYSCARLSAVYVEGNEVWTCTTHVFYRRSSSGTYSTTDHSNYDSSYDRTYTAPIFRSGTNAVTYLANGHSATFNISGNTSDYFIWYYMQTWTRE